MQRGVGVFRKRNDCAVWATFLKGRLITFLGPLVAQSLEVEIAEFGFCRNRDRGS